MTCVILSRKVWSWQNMKQKSLLRENAGFSCSLLLKTSNFVSCLYFYHRWEVCLSCLFSFIEDSRNTFRRFSTWNVFWVVYLKKEIPSSMEAIWVKDPLLKTKRNKTKEKNLLHFPVFLSVTEMRCTWGNILFLVTHIEEKGPFTRKKESVRRDHEKKVQK